MFNSKIRIPLFVLWPRLDKNGRPILSGILRKESRAGDAVTFAGILSADGAELREIRTGGDSDWDPDEEVMKVAFRSCYRSEKEFLEKKDMHFRNLQEMSGDAVVNWKDTWAELDYAGRRVRLFSTEGGETRIEIGWMEPTDEAERLAVERRINALFVPSEPFEVIAELGHTVKPAAGPSVQPFEKTEMTAELIRDAKGLRYVCAKRNETAADPDGNPVELVSAVYWRVVSSEDSGEITKDNWKEHIWDGGEL